MCSKAKTNLVSVVWHFFQIKCSCSLQTAKICRNLPNINVCENKIQCLPLPTSTPSLGRACLNTVRCRQFRQFQRQPLTDEFRQVLQSQGKQGKELLIDWNVASMTMMSQLPIKQELKAREPKAAEKTEDMIRIWYRMTVKETTSNSLHAKHG